MAQTPAPDLPIRTGPRADPGRRLWIWVVYACLYAASIPWYLPSNERPPVWFGLPYWVVLSLTATSAIAVFTLFVVSRYWSEAPEEAGRDAPEAR
ncbi:MAG: hypothetical protein OEW19_01735 [Acidobacteriota bacterium]|nr:hypothetical protein [Acidobacteriota bacterium]